MKPVARRGIALGGGRFHGRADRLADLALRGVDLLAGRAGLVDPDWIWLAADSTCELAWLSAESTCSPTWLWIDAA